MRPAAAVAGSLTRQHNLGSACLELAMQIVHQGVHILAEAVVLLQADEVGDEGVCNGGVLALPGCPVGYFSAHCCNGVEPSLQQGRVQLMRNGSAGCTKLEKAALHSKFPAVPLTTCCMLKCKLCS